MLGSYDEKANISNQQKINDDDSSALSLHIYIYWCRSGNNRGITLRHCDIICIHLPRREKHLRERVIHHLSLSLYGELLQRKRWSLSSHHSGLSLVWRGLSRAQDTPTCWCSLCSTSSDDSGAQLHSAAADVQPNQVNTPAAAACSC